MTTKPGRFCGAIVACAALFGIALTVSPGHATDARPKPDPYQPVAMRPTPPFPDDGDGIRDIDEGDDMRRDDDPSWRRLGTFSTFSPLTAAAEENRFGASGAGGAAEGESVTVARPAVPVWRIGDKFIYDDGGWQRLSGDENGELRFVDQSGAVSLRDADFTRPARREEQDGKTRESRVVPPSVGEAAESSIWPLASGKSCAFIEDGFARSADASETSEYRALWRCQAIEAAAKETTVGQYDRQQIICRRMGKDDTEILEEIRWEYAPRIQYWLSRENRLPTGGRQRRELAAILPDLHHFAADGNEAEEIRSQWQDSLAATPRGETDLWLAADGSRSVAITPGPAFRRPDGSLCRRYIQRLQSQDFDRVYPGMACENPSGAWQIPRR
ncbi:MAG: hypothetical protein LBU39_11985 [Desulfobulbaceae bacterium]|jgi:hypothetical protein|nr:hypothetical protein [Desulfobulbaceae bacterium]